MSDQQATPMPGEISDDPRAVLTARMDRLEKAIEETRELAEEARRDAEEASSNVDRLEDDVRDLEGDDPPDYDNLRELRNEIRYLTQRLDRLEMAMRQERSAAS